MKMTEREKRREEEVIIRTASWVDISRRSPPAAYTQGKIIFVKTQVGCFFVYRRLIEYDPYKRHVDNVYETFVSRAPQSGFFSLRRADNSRVANRLKQAVLLAIFPDEP